jgi:hypothetical protein
MRIFPNRNLRLARLIPCHWIAGGEKEPDSGLPKMKQRSGLAHNEPSAKRASEQQSGYVLGVWSREKRKEGLSKRLKLAEGKKKRSSQASWKHAAWELLSPDLRCFWKHHVEIFPYAQEY